MTLSIPGYQIAKMIHESSHSFAYRATRLHDSQPVVIKVHREDYPPLGELVQYQREFQVLALLQDTPSVVHALALEKVEQRLALVLEDFGAVSLRALLEQARPSLEQGLRLAIQATAALGDIHRARIVHKDINPGNLLINRDTGELKIADFGIAAQVSKEHTAFQAISQLEGTLAYISPEQTGRMSASIDFRTDFYSLGATFYQLFTGRLPFETQERSQLIHFHIAKNPAPPHQQDARVPQALSEIILKLMQKDPAARYQSARGILADLQECLLQLTSQGEIRPFPVGERDHSEKLIIRDALYGREAAASQLRQIFERVCQGARELVLVAGYSGIGKTSLVRQLFAPITIRQGVFLSGKFDVLHRDKPYTAFSEAFEGLCLQILAERDEVRSRQLDKLRQVLGSSGQLILDLVPNLHKLLGPQPPLSELPPMERQNRFERVYQLFVSSISSAERPLVLFIDDVQRADLASLRLLELTLTASDARGLMVIAAFRDNEVTPTHPLVQTIAFCEKRGQTVSRLNLVPLTLPDITSLVSDTLGEHRAEIDDLARLLWNKTDGNPFFLKEYLYAIHQAGQLVYRPADRRWSFSLDEIRLGGITENVADLLANKIKRFDPEVQTLIQTGACLGSQIDLRVLAAVLAVPWETALLGLTRAAAEGLLLSVGSVSEARTQQTGPVMGQDQILYQFAHDRIQQSAYSLLSAEERQRTHLRIGQLLLAEMGQERLRDDLLFHLVHHLNLAADLIESQEERTRLAGLNHRCGTLAKLSAAYDPALKYFRNGIGLLAPQTSWQTHYHLTLTLFEDAAECALLTGDFGLTASLTDAACENVAKPLDALPAYQTRIESHTAQHRLPEALATGIKYLRIFGVRVPLQPGKLALILELLKTQVALKRRPIPALLDLPQMTDPVADAVVRILRHVAAAAYWSNPKLMAFLTFRQARLIIRHGHNAWSASVFASLGLTLCGVIGDIDTGYQLGELSNNLMEKYPKTKQICRSIFVVNSMIRHWKEPLTATLTPLRDGFQVGLDLGDLEWGTLCGVFYCQHLFFIGHPLVELDAFMVDYQRRIQEYRQELQVAYHEVYFQMVRNLRGLSADPCVLNGEVLRRNEALEFLRSSHAHSGIYGILSLEIMLNVLFHRHRQAVSLLEPMKEFERATPGTFMSGRYCFYESLACLNQSTVEQPREKKRLLARVGANLKRLKKWAAHSPQNHRHPYLLLEAEWQRVHGNPARARALYEATIQQVEAGPFLSDEALARELFGLFLFQSGNRESARKHLHDARYAYLKWGAAAKVQEMDEKIGRMF